MESKQNVHQLHIHVCLCLTPLKVSASPTHGPHVAAAAAAAAAATATYGPAPAAPTATATAVTYGPLSFEQAVAMGRGGRLLPSPVPNGYKPQISQAAKQQRTPRARHSDSDEDDWC